MGIHGLTKFIEENSDLLKDHKLHDCRVVIDASLLYHVLFFKFNVRFQFGGDYDIFQRKIAEIFTAFKLCNIEAFLVFDGAYTVDGKKFKTVIKRSKDRVRAALRISRGKEEETLIPCLAQQAFRQALDELGIQHVTCDFEADNQMATLANQWNCPVISNDSDFYIFELSGGFIPLDHINFLPCQSGERPFLRVKYYKVDKFTKRFNVNRSVLPLFSTMLGNDYIQESTFRVFYSRIANTDYSVSRKQMEIISVLRWLVGEEECEELVSEVLTSILPEMKTEVETLMRNSIKGYRDIHDFESFDLKKFFEGDRTAAAKEKTDFVTSAWGKHLPAWFVTACRCGEIPASLLNVALTRWIILPIQVEGKYLPASPGTSTAIRKVAYNLLLRRSQAQQPLETKPPESDTAKTQKPPETRPADINTVYSQPLDAARQPCSVQYPGGGSPESDDVPSSSDVEKIDTVKSNAEFSSDEMSSSSDVEETDTVKSDAEFSSDEMSSSSDIDETDAIQTGAKFSSDDMSSPSDVEENDTVKSSAEFSSDDMSSPSGVEETDTAKSSAKESSEETDVVRLSGKLSRARYQVKVLEYTRYIDQLRRKRLRAQVTLPLFSKLPALESVDSLSEEDRRAIFLETLGVTAGFTSKFDPHLQLYIACLVFWARNAEPSATLHHLKGFVLSALLLHVHKEIADRNAGKHADVRHQPGSCPEISMIYVCSSADDELLRKVSENLKKYYDIIMMRRHRDETIHRPAQFQACLRDADDFNRLLRCPLPTLQPAVLINGSFIYTIVRRLQKSGNPESFLSKKLVKGSVLAAFFHSLWSEVVAEAGDSVFQQVKPIPEEVLANRDSNPFWNLLIADDIE